MSLADDYGTDVEIYRRWGSPVVYADTRTDAPSHLLALLDEIGFERHTLPTPGPTYLWHQLPGHLDEMDGKRAATWATQILVSAGWRTNIAPALLDKDAPVASPQAARAALTALCHPAPDAAVPPVPAGAAPAGRRRR